MNFNGHEVKAPPLTNILQICQIIVLVGIGISWWTGKQSSSNVQDATQNLAIEEHGRRIDLIDAQLGRLADNKTKITPDLNELITNFRIWVNLLDGAKPHLDSNKQGVW